ncbi:hypothetical protein B0T17DRAFT_508292 [Bombardia bombarda]|uniref:mRNA 3'-end-processing protein RNA14 n=1 Tax=Bombardia bombarda TaxID=252184 RepID=A0AA39X1W6_9PEZI|nr:hypothetical protein B0T17DRAFT_508292 [Bombardia bombarda]
MAEYDPSHQGGAWDDNEGYEVTDGDQQEGEDLSQHSSDEEEEEEEEEAEYSVDPAHDASGDLPSLDGNTDDAGEYDPASVTSVPNPASHVVEPRTSLKPSLQPATKRPRTAGGFLVGDSSDEEDEGEEHVPAPSGPAPGPVSQSSIPPPLPVQSPVTARDSAAVLSNAPPAYHAGAAPAAAISSSRNESDSGVTSSRPAPVASPAQQAPVDHIAFYEEKIRDDPRGARDSWLVLLAEHRARGDIEAAREVYERFFAIFPQAADIWAQYLEMELGLNNFPEAERIFGKCLMGTPNVNLWTKYLDYIRRRNDLTNDSTGQARQTVSQAYEFVIDNIGLDKDSGKIWYEYIQFLMQGPGTPGGSQWQDQQKMDQLRKAYQRAICVPISNINILWKEYDKFEMNLNKLTGRKYLAEKSPSYMSAKSANTALENLTRGLQRTNVPRLAPAPGFDGDQEYMDQVQVWKRWIAWEKSDPLDLKDDKDQPGLLQKRILYAYNQALMALRFWPEMWVNAAQWCFDNNITTNDNNVLKDGNTNGLEFLTRGIEANPESVLLALKHADHIESTYPIQENDEAKIERGKAVRAPYNKVLDTLYGIIKALKERETSEIARIEEASAVQDAVNARVDDDEDEDEAEVPDRDSRDNKKTEQIKAIQQGYAAQTQLLSRTISFVWIALIRAMRRIQGKGKPNTELGGMRQAFMDARQAGRLTSDVYAAVAQMEWTLYRDQAGGKIFDRGARLFPLDENFTLENIKYLHSRDDFQNARVLFQTVVNKLTENPETLHKSKVLYAYFHKYESQYGELVHITELEKRMAELFPEDPKLAHFSARYSSDKFDPIAARIIVSPATQLRPKLLMPSIEQPASLRNSPYPAPFAAHNSPRPQFQQAVNSPKRPAPADDFDEPPRKIQRNEHHEFQRGVSPLKGAAGRRLDQQRRMQGQGAASYNAAPAPIARDITFLLGQIPRAETYDNFRVNPVKMVNLLRDTIIPDYATYKANNESANAAPRGGHSHSHNRQASADYPVQYGYQNRDSPAPHGRPMSPYPAAADNVRSRLATAAATYRQSSLRPGSSGSYEPPPAVYSQQGPPPPQVQYNHAPPPLMSQGQYDGAVGIWAAQYGAPPPQMQSYAPPPPMGYAQGPPPPQQDQYPRYPY